MYVLRDSFDTYEIWDPYASRRVTASWFPLESLDALRALAGRLVRDEENRNIMTQLVHEHEGRTVTTAAVAVAECFASLLHAGRLVLRGSRPARYPLPDPWSLQPAVDLKRLSDPGPTLPPPVMPHAVPLPARSATLPLGAKRVHPVVVPRDRMHRVQPGVLHTPPGSGLLIPGPATDECHPLEGVMAALDRLASHPREVMVLVGHGGPEDPTDARELGRARATALHAIVVGDRSAWVRTATHHGRPHDIQLALRYLGRRRRWRCEPDQIDGVDSSSHRSAVHSFQVEHNERYHGALLEDGVCGRKTLGALFDVFHEELHRWLDKHGLDRDVLRLHPRTPVLHAATEWLGHPRGPGTRGHLVDVLVLDPAPLGLDGPLEPADLYEHSFATIEPLPVVHEPGDWEHGQLTVVTDLGPAYVEVHERYRLHAHDGSYDVELDTAIDGVLDDGAIELRFEGIPVGPTYALSVTNAAGRSFVLFEGLRYDQFHPRAIGEFDEDTAPPTAA